MKLSLIIPVYNAEKFLYKCLQSIVIQNFDERNFEVILINDGSTDNSLQIAESFVGRISNLIIFSQENKGEAVARNVALEMAKGEFISFLDSDDYYEEDTLKNSFENIENNKLDILYLRIRQVDEDGNFLGYQFDLPEYVGSGLQQERRPFPATIYRKTAISNTNFPLSILVGPDSVFNIIVQSRAERVSFTTKAIYNYTNRENSLSKKGFTDEAFKGYLNAIIILSKYKKSNFSVDDLKADAYFEKGLKVFIKRIIELNILPNFNKKKYLMLTSTLKQENQLYLLGSFSKKYPFVAHSFVAFTTYQKYLLFNTKIHKLIHRG